MIPETSIPSDTTIETMTIRLRYRLQREASDSAVLLTFGGRSERRSDEVRKRGSIRALSFKTVSEHRLRHSRHSCRDETPCREQTGTGLAKSSTPSSFSGEPDRDLGHAKESDFPNLISTELDALCCKHGGNPTCFICSPLVPRQCPRRQIFVSGLALPVEICSLSESGLFPAICIPSSLERVSAELPCFSQG
jgi:hypothetical protein